MPVPEIDKPSRINPFYVLILCIILTIMNLFICYRMSDDVRTELDTFIFSHKNDPLKHHPLSKRNSSRIDELNAKLDVYINKAQR